MSAEKNVEDLENATVNQNEKSEKHQPIPAKEQKKGKMVSTNVKTGLLMGFGAFAVVLGAIAVIYWPALFLSQLRGMMTLSPTSMSFDIWREVPIPMYLECHMFNITNVDEILAKQNVSLKVEQFGPYVFRETHTKENITWNDENSTITFYNKRTWHYEPEMSNGSLSDMITSINPIVVTVAYFVRHQRDLIKFPVDVFLRMYHDSLFLTANVSNFPTVAYFVRHQRDLIKFPVDVFLRMYHDSLFLTANVSSWLFDGIEDPVLDIASHFPDLPINIPYDKFGWFYDRNGSMEFDGSFNMHTGASDFSQLGMLKKWNYSNRTFYRGQCGEVRGSTGELWAPELGQPEVEVFASDLCGYIVLNKDQTVVVDGIEGVQYAANNSVFDNGYNYEAMACFCDEVRDENCLPPGALNVSLCRLGAPAFVSLPHFLNSDPKYPSKIEGLDPRPEHNFRLALEMYTGMPLAVSAQLQINLLVRHISAISINNQLPDPDVLVPMFWFRQEVEVTPEYARLAKFALNMRYGLPYGLYALTAIGIALLIAGITILIRKLIRSQDTTPILDQEDENTQ